MFYVNLSALNPVFKDGLTSTYNEQTNQLEVGLSAPIPDTRNFVTTDTEQTITGLKTIGETSGTISEVDFSGFTFKLSNKAINNPEADIKIRNSSYDGYQYPTMYSSKGLYVNLAKIKLGDDGNNTYGITMPDSTTWESDRVLATTSDIPSLNGYATQTWVQEQGYATSSSLATVATTGNYNDLTDKPTIPDAVSGTNDGTNWTTLTIGNSTYDIPQGGSAPGMIGEVIYDVPSGSTDLTLTMAHSFADYSYVDIQ